MRLQITYYMDEYDLVLNNLQWLICHETKPFNYMKTCLLQLV